MTDFASTELDNNKKKEDDKDEEKRKKHERQPTRINKDGDKKVYKMKGNDDVKEKKIAKKGGQK